MKWYNVKKFLPCDYEEVICRVIDKEELESIVMASYAHDRKKWDFNHHTFDERYRFTVTHFCIPDPIEIED